MEKLNNLACLSDHHRVGVYSWMHLRDNIMVWLLNNWLGRNLFSPVFNGTDTCSSVANDWVSVCLFVGLS